MLRLGKVLGRLGWMATVVAMAAMALWWSATLLIASGWPDPWRVVAAVAVALGYLAIAGFIGAGRRRWQAMAAAVVMLAPLMVWWHSLTPSNNRAWQPDVGRLAHATINGDQVTVHNIRDFSYTSEFDYKPHWIDRRYDLNSLIGVDLFAVYWMGPDIAHIFVSFVFKDQEPLAISIEARKELSESYSTVNGLFKQYELVYIVATERDVVKLRTNYRHDPPEVVYRYRIHSRDGREPRAFFLAYLDRINALYAQPEFYNTLTTNCTTSIWLQTLANPGHIPFSWKLLASGHVPEYLYEQGRLDTRLPYSRLQELSLVNPKAVRTGDSGEFSTLIRAATEPDSTPSIDPTSEGPAR
ncbi:MAG: DUF4105 domain-containing protein [Burkholderiaceae bacterium]|nr:DUF4105 domain-containing protein [Burkholderiaceae bacterium]